MRTAIANGITIEVSKFRNAVVDEVTSPKESNWTRPRC